MRLLGLTDVLTDPVRITVGGVGEANSDVTQNFLILTKEDDKWQWVCCCFLSCVSGPSHHHHLSSPIAPDELAPICG